MTTGLRRDIQYLDDYDRVERLLDVIEALEARVKALEPPDGDCQSCPHGCTPQGERCPVACEFDETQRDERCRQLTGN